jgi:hypothetical protein
MAVSTQPSFAFTPHTSAAVVPATADTSLTAPSNVATVFTAGANGSRIDIIRIIQIATTTGTAGFVNLFLYDGTTYHFLDFFNYVIGTVSASVQVQPVDLYYPQLTFATGWTLVATVTEAGGESAFNVVAMGGDF